MNDRDFLMFIHDRLAVIHGENQDTDFMIKLRAIARSLHITKETPIHYIPKEETTEEATARCNLPIQPLYIDHRGVLRFRGNSLVRYILEAGGIDMNDLACLPFPVEDRRQFAQLIGYSLSGYGDLSYVDNATYESAERMRSEGTTSEQEKVLYYTRLIEELKKSLKDPISQLFEIHPNNLERL